MRHLRPARAAVWLSCIGSVAHLACGDAGDPPPPGLFVAPLPAPVASMTAAQWVSLARRLDETDNPMSAARTVDRNCAGCPGNLMTVSIAAVRDARRVGGSATPPNGVVVARVIPATASGQLEDRYGFRDGPFAYLLVVTPPSGTATFGRWTLVEFSRTTNANGRREYTHLGTLASGAYNSCNHPPRPEPADATFATCETAPRAVSPTEDVIARAVGRSNVAGPSDPMWVSCAAGCCTAENGFQ